MQVCNHDSKYQLSKTLNSVCIFSPSNPSYISPNTVCCLELITSSGLSPDFLLNLQESTVPQSIITFNAKSLCKKILFGCFFGLSAN